MKQSGAAVRERFKRVRRYVPGSVRHDVLLRRLTDRFGKAKAREILHDWQQRGIARVVSSRGQARYELSYFAAMKYFGDGTSEGLSLGISLLDATPEDLSSRTVRENMRGREEALLAVHTARLQQIECDRRAVEAAVEQLRQAMAANLRELEGIKHLEQQYQREVEAAQARVDAFG